jgi:hypothetical protein
MNWQPINTAPHDSKEVLVNDTNPGASPWVAARWLETPEWSGWRYCDELLNDSSPLGPMPTLWLDVPPFPEA